MTMVDCQHVMKRLWEYLDGELPAADFAQLREHLAVCARCNPQYRFQLAFLTLVARAAAARGPRPEFRERLMAALASVEP
jgi:mycothiol system anti-sigma-R factor